MNVMQWRLTRTIAGISLTLQLFAWAQEPNAAGVIRGVDAAVASRFNNILSFTDVEHYAIYRGGDQTHPAAEMTVRDHYQKGAGKTYTVLSERGSSILLHFGLKPLLESEQNINLPGNVQRSWFNSSNYEMKLDSTAVRERNGRQCYALDIAPREKAPNLIIGTIWVDARDQTLVEINGVASKDPSAFSGTTHMMREYTNINGFSMATHARAESDSPLFGHTVVIIDYSDYKLEVKSRK